MYAEVCTGCMAPLRKEPLPRTGPCGHISRVLHCSDAFGTPLLPPSGSEPDPIGPPPVSDPYAPPPPDGASLCKLAGPSGPAFFLSVSPEPETLTQSQQPRKTRNQAITPRFNVFAEAKVVQGGDPLPCAEAHKPRA